ncbi:MAG: 50S ribosomal protein L25 [Acidobacteria bacterium]|nr:50S ribosomal protein L25 [Acidobacteriota bacterium]
MSEVTLVAETGRELGTRPSRRARREGRIPGVVYGAGEAATTLTVDRADLRRALSTDAGVNALITLTVDGESHLAVVRELQRHPVRREVVHIDFLKVDPSAPIEVEVPIRLVGEAKQVTTNGGMTEQRLSVLRVVVRPDSIPDAIECDISEMSLENASILVSDLQLPEGLETRSPAQQAVVTAELTRAAVTSRGAGDESAEAPADGEASDGDESGD